MISTEANVTDVELKSTASEKVLDSVKRMLWPVAALNAAAPVIVNTPESVMSPVVAVAVSAPPIVVAPKSSPESLTTVAAAVVVRINAPSTEDAAISSAVDPLWTVASADEPVVFKVIAPEKSFQKYYVAIKCKTTINHSSF